MPSKQRFEGYLLIDHRNSPGLPEELDAALGRPIGSGQGTFECPTITCGHCQVIVVVNPLRNRTRGYCPKCDTYVCDACEAIRAMKFECRTMKKVVDDAREAAYHGTLEVPPLLAGV